ncbi:CYFA0S12e03290g1_1 [Cyberlindnera fabianii]|uniref:ATP synthase subunit delta, mitochondrial n=1 Tax=Cyberlindnera fabianii TaxID=36022 RepID=A0A061B2K1_CYBFA|nr:ATP synthase subunit delta, mitochondrial [Cyberlindnera fabianii]CDR43691.1 CYFA0S12e03290g1_1 [Cyberlindnera fabianii]
MFRLNALRTVARQANTVARRGYADVASSDALKLSLVLPHETIFAGKEVTQVNVPGVNGEFGILANHVPIIEQLRPGVIQITETSGTTKDYFVSGGFATVQPGSVLSITAIEAFEPTAFSSEAIKSQLAEAQKNVNSSDEAVAATASIQVEVLEALQAIAK